jgi:hypothetical protein
VAALDLGAFPALSWLTLNGVGMPLQHALERSWIMTLQTISYRLLWVGWEKNLRQLESMLSGAVEKMPRLRLVAVTIVVSEISGPQTNAEWRGAIGERMPQLVGRGILEIEVVAEE